MVFQIKNKYDRVVSYRFIYSPVYYYTMHQHFHGVVSISRRDLTEDVRTVRECGLSIDRLASLYSKRLHTTPLRPKSLFYFETDKALCLALPMCIGMGVTLVDVQTESTFIKSIIQCRTQLDEAIRVAYTACGLFVPNKHLQTSTIWLYQRHLYYLLTS